jgi:hypothetical protein
MSEDSGTNTGTTLTPPPGVVAYRAATAAVTTLILLFLALGVAGYGPLEILHQAVHPLTHLFHLDRISG